MCPVKCDIGEKGLQSSFEGVSGSGACGNGVAAVDSRDADSEDAVAQAVGGAGFQEGAGNRVASGRD